MPEPTPALPAVSFIPQDLRPEAALLEEISSLGPDSSVDELGRQAAQLIGPLLAEQIHREAVLGGGAIFTRSPDVIFTPVDGDTVLLHLRSGIYYSLDPVGTMIWEQLSESTTLAQVCSAVCDRFAVSAEEAWGDLSALVCHLKAEQLVIEMAS
jgi:hypothetical protein